MSSEEKRAWIMVVTTIVSFAIYVAILLGRANGTTLSQVSYVSAMLWTIGAAIVASIVLQTVVSTVSPRDAGKKDERDREINRFGEHIGGSFLVLGGVAALIMAMAETDYFWIANVIYLGFGLSSVMGSVAKIVVYRRGLPRW